MHSPSGHSQGQVSRMTKTENALEIIKSENTSEQSRDLALAMATYMYDIGSTCNDISQDSLESFSGQWQGTASTVEAVVKKDDDTFVEISAVFHWVDRREAGADTPVWQIEGRFFMGHYYNQPNPTCFRITRIDPAMPLENAARELLFNGDQGILSRGGL